MITAFGFLCPFTVRGTRNLFILPVSRITLVSKVFSEAMPKEKQTPSGCHHRVLRRPGYSLCLSCFIQNPHLQYQDTCGV